MPPIDGPYESGEASHQQHASDQHLARRAIGLSDEISGFFGQAVTDAGLGRAEQTQAIDRVDKARDEVKKAAHYLELISSATDSVWDALSLFGGQGQWLPESVYQAHDEMGGERVAARAQLETRLAQFGQVISELSPAEALAGTVREMRTTIGISGTRIKRIAEEWGPEQRARLLDTATLLAGAEVRTLRAQLGAGEPHTAEQRPEEAPPGALPLGPMNLETFNAEEGTWQQHTLGHVTRAYYFKEQDPENPLAQEYLGRVQEALAGVRVTRGEDNAVERTRELCAMLVSYKLGLIRSPRFSEEEVRGRYDLLQFDDMPLSNQWGRRQE